MAVKIKLKRLGKVREPYYRVIVIDAHAKRDGRAIEEIGKYAPKENPSHIEVDSPRVQHWLSVGAQPTEPVRALLEKTGDWQLFKGQEQPRPLRIPGAKPDKKTVFEAAAREAQDAAEQAQSGQSGKGKKSSGKAESKAAPRSESASATGTTDSGEAQREASSGDEGQTTQSEG